MRYGVTMFVTDRSMSATALARAVEERGLDALYLPEHTHIPTSRKTQYPLGDVLPEEYKRTIDPFVGLAAAAAVTTKLRIGTGICLVAQRDPIITAKEVASLDLMSGGRFVFGIGVGWNEDEAVDHGIDFGKRRSIVRDRVLIMQRLWADEVASYEGPHAKLSPSWAWPKPMQKPRPPVYYGGLAQPKLFDHIAEYCDGWIPLGGSGVKANMDLLRAAYEKRGRDPKTARVILFGVNADPAKLDYYATIPGADEATFYLPSGDADAVLPVLDGYAKLVASRR